MVSDQRPDGTRAGDGPGIEDHVLPVPVGCGAFTDLVGFRRLLSDREYVPVSSRTGPLGADESRDRAAPSTPPANTKIHAPPVFHFVQVPSGARGMARGHRPDGARPGSVPESVSDVLPKAVDGSSEMTAEARGMATGHRPDGARPGSVPGSVSEDRKSVV